MSEFLDELFNIGGQGRVSWDGWVEEAVADNAFCPTGPGGGVDPSCSPHHVEYKSEHAKAVAEKLLGDVSAGKAIGAPEGSVIRVSAQLGHRINITVEHADVAQFKMSVFTRGGEKVVYINELFLMPREKGSGMGTKVFGDMVDGAKAIGAKSLECHAAAGEGINGYYTWPRFGFDEKFDSLDLGGKEGQLKSLFPKAKSVQSLMSTEAGRQWWKQNGTDMFHAKFDLTEGSRSTRVWSAYLKERAKRAA